MAGPFDQSGQGQERRVGNTHRSGIYSYRQRATRRSEQDRATRVPGCGDRVRRPGRVLRERSGDRPVGADLTFEGIPGHTRYRRR